jgi:hypothetical protein
MRNSYSQTMRATRKLDAVRVVVFGLPRYSGPNPMPQVMNTPESSPGGPRGLRRDHTFMAVALCRPSSPFSHAVRHARVEKTNHSVHRPVCNVSASGSGWGREKEKQASATRVRTVPHGPTAGRQARAPMCKKRCNWLPWPGRLGDPWATAHSSYLSSAAIGFP